MHRKYRHTCTNDGYLFVEATLDLWNDLLWYIMLVCLEILHCDKFLYFIDSDRLIDRCTGTCILAASVTYMSADCRKWIVLLDQSQGFFVSALCSHLQITLYRNVCRTCCLTWSSTSLVCIDTVDIAVILCPHIRRPLLLGWEWHLRIYDLRSVLLAEPSVLRLRHWQGKLNTTSAGNTVILYNMCYISRT